MSFVTDIKWQGAETFWEIEVWFCLPMLEFLKMFDEEFVMNQFGPEDSRAAFYYYEMRNKIEDLQKLFSKLYDEYTKNPIPVLDKSEMEPLSDESKKMLAEKLATIREKPKESTDTAEQAAQSAEV